MKQDRKPNKICSFSVFLKFVFNTIWFLYLHTYRPKMRLCKQNILAIVTWISENYSFVSSLFFLSPWSVGHGQNRRETKRTERALIECSVELFGDSKKIRKCDWQSFVRPGIRFCCVSLPVVRLHHVESTHEPLYHKVINIVIKFVEKMLRNSVPCFHLLFCTLFAFRSFPSTFVWLKQC